MKNQYKNGIKKIAVRAPQWLGDAVVSTIFLSHLRKMRPEAEIHVISPPAFEPIFSSHPAVASVIPLPAPYRWNIGGVARRLKNEQFDEIFVLPRSARTALEPWLAGIPARIGFGGDMRSLLFTKTNRYDFSLPYPRRYLSLIDDEKSPSLEKPAFPAREPTADEWRSIGQEANPVLKKPVMGVAPVSIAASRTWSPDRFADIIRRFHAETGGTVVLIGGRRDEDALRAIANRAGAPAIVQAGRFSFPALGGLLSRLDLFLGNDSGLMHVASAFDCPSIILFGASDPAVAIPQTGRVRAIQHAEVACVPCLRNYCVRFGDHHLECLAAITTDEAWSEIEKILTRQK